jgi:hypothetical protein
VSRTSPLTRELIGEFVGTFILILFGTAAVAQYVVSEGKAGDWSTLTWGWVAGLADPRHPTTAADVVVPTSPAKETTP